MEIKMTIQINDPWFENLYYKEFGANTTKFIDEIKMLLVERYQREKQVISLLHQYQDSKISIGKIAENLHIDKEKVLALLAQHNIDFVDYDMGEEKRNIDDFMCAKFKKRS
jgi:predicted HTH domain antitoxin